MTNASINASTSAFWGRTAVLLIAGLTGCSQGGGASRHDGDAVPDAADVWDRPKPDLPSLESPGTFDAAEKEIGTFQLPRIPADPMLTRLLVSGPAFLVGWTGVGCSQSVSPGSERWCAFYRANADKTAELWVLNVTKATTGAVPTCDGSSDDCRRLTTNLWTGQPVWGPWHPYAHHFAGETLVFHADAAPGMREPYEGAIWAWRPAWSGPRQLTGARGVYCSIETRTTAVFCVDDATVQRDGTGVFDRPRLPSFNLLAGKLSVEPSGPLPVVGRVSTGMDDQYWYARFSPDGEYLAFTNTEMAGGVLNIVRTDEAGRVKPSTILPGAADWEIAHDGTKIYYLAGLDRTLGEAATGTLMLADFPTGANTGELQKDVLSYRRLGARDEVVSDVDRGVLIRRLVSPDRVASYLLRDRTRPSDLFSLGTNLSSVQVATDLRHTIYLFSPRNNPLAFVTRNDGSGSCLLTSDPYAETYGTHFTDSGERAIWIEYGRNQSASEEGWHARPETCEEKTKFGDFVLDYNLFGDEFVVFEGGDLEDTTSWLQYTPLRPVPGAPPPLPTVVKEHPYSTVGIFTAAGSTWIVFAVSANDPEAGMYLHGPLRRD